MDASLYPMIFKRKSFHTFRSIERPLSSEELSALREAFAGFEPLIPDIRVGLRIVSTKEKPFKRDAEYCVLLYSEKKEGWLQNLGYLGQQLDLWLAANDIGCVWYGLGKTDLAQWDGLDFGIMLAIAKATPDSFRKDMFKAKRKPMDDLRSGEGYDEILNIARFAPSACNSQPWFVECHGSTLDIFREKTPKHHGIFPVAALRYFNQIDLGIFLCILELCLQNADIPFRRTLYPETENGNLLLNARYELTK